jgi:hypothetical protein
VGKKGGGEAAQARADEQARQEKIRKGTAQIGDIFDKNFNDDFFTKRRQSYLDFASPQLEDQYGKAQRELTYSLARSGNLDSSARADLEGQLKKLYDTNKQQIADQALGYEKDARTGVEDARSGLVTTLNATGDVDSAVNSANARAAALSKPATYSPLAQLFADFTAGLGTQAAQERAAYMSGGAYQPRYNTGLFGTPTNAVKVT